MIARSDRRAAAGPRAAMRAPNTVQTVRMQVLATLALVFSIMVAATAVSMGVARAQGVHAMNEPDTGLVIALMIGAIGIMGALSAVAVRLVGRPRSR